MTAELHHNQVERYTRAEHLLHDPALLRLSDLNREYRIYTEAATLIRNSPLMVDLDDESALRALSNIPQESQTTKAQATASANHIALRTLG